MKKGPKRNWPVCVCVRERGRYNENKRRLTNGETTIRKERLFYWGVEKDDE